MTNTRFRAARIGIGRGPGWSRLAALVAAVLLAGLTVGTAAGASETLVPACDGVNIRTAASTTAPIKDRLSLASTVTVSGTVAGASWGTSCPDWKSGSTLVCRDPCQRRAGRHALWQAAADSVISATAGQVLRRGPAIVNALFHSTAGGATENNENAFVSSTGTSLASPVAYLRGSADRDPAGVPYDTVAPYAAWQSKAYTVTALSGIFAKDPRTAVGTLSALDLRRRGVSGRLISVTLVGSGGTKIVSGAVFVAVFNAGKPSVDPMLRSTLLDVAPIP